MNKIHNQNFTFAQKHFPSNPSSKMQPTTTETDFLSDILRGDRRALETMYNNLFPLARKIVADLNGTENDAKDVFQDAVMVVFDKARQPGFSLESKFSTFFYGICRNLWLNRLQKKSRSHVAIPDDAKFMADSDADFDWLRHERLGLLGRAMLKLGEDCRRLMQLHLQKKSVEEITAAMLFNSEAYTRRRKHQCKERLIGFVKNAPVFHDLF